MKTKPKFFVYSRKSTDEEKRQVMSLDAQTRAMRNLSRQERLPVVEVIEESMTAKRPGRPRFDKMLDRIEKGEANGILCWDIDRLYRNPIDEGRVRWLLQKGVIASIRTPNREFFPEDAGLLMGVEGGRATDFIIRMAKNIRRGLEEKLHRGEWPSQAPLGYVYDPILRNIVFDPKTAKFVQSIFADHATGQFSLEATSRKLFEFGIKSRSGGQWSKWATRRFLSNRRYIGVMVWGGEVYEGKYKLLISHEIFEAVQAVLKTRSRRRKVRNGHNFPFCGVFHCTCGAMITAQWAVGRHGGRYRYYRCSRKLAVRCAEPYVQEKSVAEQSLRALRPLAISASEAANLRALIESAGTKEGDWVKDQIDAERARLDDAQGKLNRLTRAYLDERIDDDAYLKTKEELTVEKTDLKRKIERLRKTGSSAWIEPALEVVNTLGSIGNNDSEQSLPEIAHQVRKVGTNPLITAKTVSFSFRAPFDSISPLLASAPLATPTSAGSLRGENTQRLLWCRGGDSNP